MVIIELRRSDGVHSEGACHSAFAWSHSKLASSIGLEKRDRAMRFVAAESQASSARSATRLRGRRETIFGARCVHGNTLRLPRYCNDKPFLCRRQAAARSTTRA